MAKRPFMEMDLDDFEEKKDEGVIDEPSLDFDFDENVEETTPDTETQTENKEGISEGYKAYLADVEAYKNNPQEILDKLKELVSPKTLPEDFINGVGVFSKNDYPNATISKDGEIIYCVDGMYSVPQIIRYYKDEDGVLDKDLLPLSDDGHGNEIVLRMSDGTYHVHYHDRFKDGKNIMIQIASSFDELIKTLDSENNEPTEETSDETITDDSSETPEIPEEPNLDEPEATQEGYVMEAFGTILAKEWIKKPEVIKEINDGIDRQFTSLFSFGIKPTEADLAENRKKILAKNIEPHILMSMYAKKSFDAMLEEEQRLEEEKLKKEMEEMVAKIMGKRDEPKQESFSFGKLPFSRFYQEADESTLKWINRDASKIAKMWKESQFSENHTKSVSDLINEYRKYYETNFRIKKPVLDKAFDVISKRLTELFNKGYIFGGYVDGYKLVLFHKDWLDKDIVNRFRSRIDSNPAYLICIDTETIPHAQLGVSVIETSCDYDGKTDFGNTRKLMKQINNNAVQESYVQEANEEDVSDDDEETLELPEMPDLDEDESDEEAPEVDTTEDESPDDLEGFGMDTSDVQNEFDPKDVESLNKLIAAESEAINDYFDASKDTRDEDLRTLFSDIGHEERFHLEQLMYAKSKLTGEKYEPRDPEVKAEYEELINGGMDEDTAAYTAMDKRAMLGEDDGDDSDMEELTEEAALLNDMLYHNEILMSVCEHYMSNPTNRDKDLGVILEAFYQEAIDNVSSAPKQYTKIESPISILTKGLKVAVNGLSKMSSIIRDSMRKSKLTRERKREWIQKHGIAELFKAGIQLYLFDDRINKLDLDTPCRYVDFLYRLTKAIGESCGIKLTAAAQHKTISNPIKFKNVDEGMYKLSQVIFNKTKVVVTDDNKAALQNEFFGYSDDKLKVKVVREGTNQAVNDSGNIYNRLDACVAITRKYAEISIAVLDEIKKLEGNVNSIYYKNRSAYNKAMTNIKKVVEKYTQFINAMMHDLNEIMKLDNGLLKLTRERDLKEQSGETWEGPDIRVNKPAPQGTQYTKRKK